MELQRFAGETSSHVVIERVWKDRSGAMVIPSVGMEAMRETAQVILMGRANQMSSNVGTVHVFPSLIAVMASKTVLMGLMRLDAVDLFYRCVRDPLWRREVPMEFTEVLYRVYFVPFVTYEPETWTVNVREARKVVAMGMKLERSILTVTGRNKIENEVFRERIGRQKPAHLVSSLVVMVPVSILVGIVMEGRTVGTDQMNNVNQELVLPICSLAVMVTVLTLGGYVTEEETVGMAVMKLNVVSLSGNCLPTEFMCGEGVCIDSKQHCDNYYDCRDFSDEQNCFGCQSNEFQCGSGECVPQSNLCNGNYDCHDGSDEHGCETTPRPTQPPVTPRPTPQCPAGQSACRTGNQCVSRSAICDGRYDCQDFSDEDDCARKPCSRYEFRCENGPCISIRLRCDGKVDCPFDTSDELDCRSKDGLNLKTYPEDQMIKEGREVVFQCRDEGPLRARVRWLRGNGLPLPPGSRDVSGRLEIPDIQVEHSGTYICEAVGFPQETQGARVSVHLTVDPSGKITITPSKSLHTQLYMPYGQNPLLKYGVLPYSEYDIYNTVELPATRPPTACALNEATCSNGECIDKNRVCDGQYDCTDGSDEMRCNPLGCEPNEFRCNNKKCVLKTWRCDSDDDCGDGSDEANCATNPPGSPCRYHEFQCQTGNQCIPKSFHCDLEIDCQDGSDEVGCSASYIQVPPPPMVNLNIGSVFTITCTAIGVPTPEVVWRLNWGHIPPKCTTTSSNGLGTLTCPDVQESDQGAYSCEAINTKGSTFAIPDSILVVNKPDSVCPRGYFNEEASTRSDCISCFCFGVTTECKSADLFTYQVYTSSAESPSDNTYLYFSLPENYNGNQLKSYGGYLKYTVNYEGKGRPISAPNVILSGNGYVLTHRSRDAPAGRDTEVTVRIFYGEWYKAGSPQPGDRLNVLATREEIMMALGDTTHVLIRSQYVDGTVLDTSVFNIALDSAGVRNTGLGQATFVEECRCPAGYTGLSCEKCAPGYNRRKSGPWLGLCTREPVRCPSGYYGDPSRNIPCQVCPCPLTNPSNHLTQMEMLPVIVLKGTLDVVVSNVLPATKETLLSLETLAQEDYTIGSTCNQCKANTFFLDSNNQFGCISCFCMGITNQCQSSNWYREQVSVAFTRNTQGFKLVETLNRDEPITDNIHVDSTTRELVFQDFSRRTPDVYYWQLPTQFLGDKVTSYGGNLNYTVRYVPTPGGQSSRNSAPDVELLSSNDIRLLYFRREQIEPNQPQSISVPLLEQYWQRQDGQTANREHLLMALADLGSILIKATYTTNTREAALLGVTLDVAEERNTGQERALAVEQCVCPRGYRGLSCEDCDVGYTRALEGIYLGLCEQCNCNGHSSECNPDTGICQNCGDHTTGDQCDTCEEGYEGDATRGTPTDCQPGGRPTPGCSCDPRGSARSDCPDGEQCVCKTNVEGRSCDRCRPGTFALSSENTEGCLECLCSGVTDSCQSSNYYRTQIPMQIIDSRHGFTLTDSSRNNVVRDGFSLNVAQNEIGYTFPNSRNQRMFWSLPPAFTGNKVSSYGGSLTVTQHYTARAGAERLYDTDVVISGNGISLYWTYQGDVAPDQPLTFTVPLREASWRRLGQTGPRSASRADLLTVLSNVEAILVRASHSSQTLSTYLSDVSLDTAVPQYTGQAVAIDMEACRCPEGYRGSSCELCAPGYYRDSNDRSASLLGSCTRCPCNNHEESCSATPDGRVSCSCQSGYTGRYCNSVGLMMELVPVRVSQPVGTLVSFVCSYNSNEEMNIEFIEIPKPAVVQTTNGNNNLHHTHTITRYDSGAKRVWTVRITRWHKNVQCLVKNKAGNILGTLTSTINTDGGNGGSVDGSGDLTSSTTTTTLRPPPPPTISISVSEPTIQIVDVGSTRPVTLQWSKEGGELPRDRAIDDRQGVLVITDVRVSDSGTYICAASDGLTIVTERAVLTVGGSPPTPPQVVILPRYLEVTEGEPVEFRCEASGNPTPTLRWTARENKPLPSQASFLNGVFRIPAARKSDESEYECHASNPSGTNTQRTVLYVREGQPKPDPTSLTVEPNEYSGPGGETVRLTCLTGEQERDYTIRWSRAGGRELPPSAVQRDGVLTIYNASPADSGVYVCTATSSYTGSVDEVQARVTIVSYRGPPTVRIEPDRQTISQGTRAELRCQASGDPAPQVRWTKVGEELSSLTQVAGSLLIINSAQVRDRGVYVCTAENEGGSAQSSAIVEVERQEPPSIELYPKGQHTVVEGGRALLQCRVTGGIPSPSIRWTRPNGLALSSSVEELPGGVLRFNHITKLEEGQYSCHAENNAGSTDAVATLLVQSLPKIVLSPSNTVHVAIGQSVRLECRATGDPIPSVSWTKYLQRAYPYGGTESIIPATPQTAVYEISRVTKEDEGSYNCQARNAAGFTEDRLQLIVVEDNTIGGGSGSAGGGGGGGQGSSHRGDIPAGGDDDDDGDDYEGSNQARPGSGSQSGGGSSTGGYPTYPGQGGQGYPPNGGVQVSDNVYRILEGGRAEMRCMVRGNRERIFLNWVRSDNGQMPSDHLVRDGVLYINNIEPSAAGEYSCQGIGQNGNVLFTATATLTVIAPPRIQLNPTRQVVRPGDNAYITCSATGDQPIDIVWTAEGRALPPSVSINQGLLQFRGIAVSDAGRYVCRARNSEGEAEAVAEVIVNEHTHEQPVVTAVQHEQSASLGSSVQLRCTVPPGSVRPRLTWRRERRPLPANAVTRGDGVLILNNVQVSDEGRYICEASSEYGVASDYVTLRVELQGEGCTWSKGFLCDNGECVPLSLVCDGNPDCRDGSDEVTCRTGRGVTNIALRIEPSQEIIQIGDNVDVRCSASSDTRIAYSWSKVGERLGNNVQVIDNLLRVSDVRPSNGGVYRCTARTRQGSYTEDYVLAIQDSPDMNRDAAAVETRTAPYGSTIEMDCHTDLEPPVTFSWSKQGGSLRRDTNTRTALLNIHDINANDAGTYVCTAQNAMVKMDIPTVLVVTGVVPYFAQAPLSYMMLPTLPDAYLKFDIEVSFKPESQDGLILYNGEMRGGEDDFISLGLNGSYVEFRFDVGSTPAMIRSARPIRIGEWHTVKIERNRRDGKMTVDNDGPFVGEAVGAFQGLDLVQPLYVGGVPNFKTIHRLNGFTSGFVGCISRLVIGRVESDLMRDATLSEGVTTCETCAVNPCHNQGVCQEAAQPQGYMCICPHGFSGINCQKVGEACFPGACGTGRCVNNDEGFKCYCPFGKSGNQCENDVDIIEPAFSDEAYLAYPTPKALRRLKLSLKFNPTDADDALLLYCAQDEDGNGDYTSLAIRDKRLEFKFDTGSGPAIIRSEREIIPGEWVTVLAGRNSRSGHLSINNDPAVSGNAPGTTKGLNLRTPLYVGGYDKQRVHLAQGVGVDKGFRGCVSEIIVSGMKMDIKDSVVDAANVQDCSSLHGGSTRSDSSSSTCNRSTCLNGGVCSENRCICPERFSGRNCEKEMNLCEELRPCQNGGTCIGSTSSYRCKCPLGYGGTNCHQIADFTTEVSFHKNGYLELKNSTLPHSSTTENEIITIEFSTTDQNGLIFWHGQAPETDGKGQDYLALAVVDGFLEFSYELGSGPAQIQINNVRVDDGKRHQVVLKRQASDGSIDLDSNYTEFGESGGILKMLNTRGNIYIVLFGGQWHDMCNVRWYTTIIFVSSVSADEYNDVLGSLDDIVNK
uniref:Basement membrane-specific heparan sulfate proteoglycan core protein n=1 Tax=Timema douglasi TaxID=61478 RepID=A0A7R8Z6L9_TIMDO|nr:unnamed protein product [Timema douglasi]